MRKKYNKTYQCKSWLKKKYLDEKLSLSEIAKVCEVSSKTIRNWMLKLDVPRRSIREALEVKKKSIPEDERLRVELVSLVYLLEEFAFAARVLKKLKQSKNTEKEEQENYLRGIRREQKRRHAADRFKKKAERDKAVFLHLERETIPIDKTLQDEWNEIQAIVDEPSTGRKS